MVETLDEEAWLEDAVLGIVEEDAELQAEAEDGDSEVVDVWESKLVEGAEERSKLSAPDFELSYQ